MAISIDQIISGLSGYEDVYHWPDELRMMNRLASQVTTGVIVAIGSYRGQMDCALALDAKVPVYCVDPREAPGTHYGPVDLPYWMTNVLAMGVAAKVRPINLPSLDIAQIWWRPIGLLFIDGNHDTVWADLCEWYKHVAVSGLIVLHDSDFESVKVAAQKALDQKMMVEEWRADKTIVYRKTDL